MPAYPPADRPPSEWQKMTGMSHPGRSYMLEDSDPADYSAGYGLRWRHGS